MTQQEFETLTGMKVDQPTFQHADNIYMSAGALTKGEVCKEIKEHPWLLESNTVTEITATVIEQRALAAARLVDIEKLKAALLDAAGIADDPTTWRGVKELLGASTVITHKLANEIALDSDDVAYICENLK